MVIAACGQVAGAQHLFILNVRARNWKHLSAKTQLAQHTRHGIIGELLVVGVDRGLIAFDQLRLDDGAPVTVSLPRVPSSYLSGKVPSAPVGTK